MLGVLIRYWFGVYLRDASGEYAAGNGLELEPHLAIESDAADLALVYINLQEEFSDLADSADLFSAVVAAPDHLAQIVAKHYPRFRRHYRHSFGLALEHFVSLAKGLELLSVRVEFSDQRLEV